jgi:hypothetical protein
LPGCARISSGATGCDWSSAIAGSIWIRSCAQLRRLWESIELEIIRVLEAIGGVLRSMQESPIRSTEPSREARHASLRLPVA